MANPISNVWKGQIKKVVEKVVKNYAYSAKQSLEGRLKGIDLNRYGIDSLNIVISPGEWLKGGDTFECTLAVLLPGQSLVGHSITPKDSHLYFLEYGYGIYGDPGLEEKGYYIMGTLHPFNIERINLRQSLNFPSTSGYPYRVLIGNIWRIKEGEPPTGFFYTTKEIIRSRIIRHMKDNKVKYKKEMAEFVLERFRKLGRNSRLFSVTVK